MANLKTYIITVKNKKFLLTYPQKYRTAHPIRRAAAAAGSRISCSRRGSLEKNSQSFFKSSKNSGTSMLHQEKSEYWQLLFLKVPNHFLPHLSIQRKRKNLFFVLEHSVSFTFYMRNMRDNLKGLCILFACFKLYSKWCYTRSFQILHFRGVF